MARSSPNETRRTSDATFGTAVRSNGHFLLRAQVVANTIGFLTPIFAVLLAAIILNESLGAGRITAVALGFVGVIAVMRPTGVDFSAVLLLPAATALCYSLYTPATRSLSSEVSPTRSCFGRR